MANNAHFSIWFKKSDADVVVLIRQFFTHQQTAWTRTLPHPLLTLREPRYQTKNYSGVYFGGAGSTRPPLCQSRPLQITKLILTLSSSAPPDTACTACSCTPFFNKIPQVCPSPLKKKQPQVRPRVCSSCIEASVLHNAIT